MNLQTEHLEQEGARQKEEPVTPLTRGQLTHTLAW